MKNVKTLEDFYSQAQPNKEYYIQFVNSETIPIMKINNLKSNEIIDLCGYDCRYVKKAIEKCRDYLSKIFGDKTAEMYKNKIDKLGGITNISMQYSSSLSFTTDIMFGGFDGGDYFIEVPEEECKNYNKSQLNLPYIEKRDNKIIVNLCAYEYFYEETDDKFITFVNYSFESNHPYKVTYINSNYKYQNDIFSYDLHGLYFPELQLYISFGYIEDDGDKIKIIELSTEEILSKEKDKDKEIIDKDFIYKIDDSSKFTVETDYDNIDEFILSAPTGDIKQDTIKICTIDTKIPIIQIQKTEKDEMIFLVDLITADRKEFRLKSYMQTKEEFNQLLQETIDMLYSSPEFCKYASDIEDYIN